MRLPPFSVFLEEYRVPVFRFLMASVGPDHADDCFQETFLSALRAYPRLQPGTNLRAWILTIAGRALVAAPRAVKDRGGDFWLTDMETAYYTIWT